MKKITLVLLCIMHCALCVNLNAQVECKTIAEIKALEKGTECQYVGTATTTYYYGDYGVMMQDSTGAILLYNKNLGASKAGKHQKSKVTTNMQITDVWGTFSTEGGSLLDRIVLSDEDAAFILIEKDSVTFTPEVVDFDEYLTKLADYKGKAVTLNEINIRSIGESLNSEFYSPATGATLSVPFDNRIGNLPVKASVNGFLGRDGNGRNIFIIGSHDDITPLAFNSIKDIKNIVLKYNEDFNYDMLDTFAVSHVIKEADKTIVYIQEKDRYEPEHYDLGLRIEVPSVVNIVAGDYVAEIGRAHV